MPKISPMKKHQKPAPQLLLGRPLDDLIATSSRLIGDTYSEDYFVQRLEDLDIGNVICSLLNLSTDKSWIKYEFSCYSNRAFSHRGSAQTEEESIKKRIINGINRSLDELIEVLQLVKKDRDNEFTYSEHSDDDTLLERYKDYIGLYNLAKFSYSVYKSNNRDLYSSINQANAIVDKIFLNLFSFIRTRSNPHQSRRIRKEALKSITTNLLNTFDKVSKGKTSITPTLKKRSCAIL